MDLVSRPKPLVNLDMLSDSRCPEYSEIEEVNLHITPNIQSLYLRRIITEYEQPWPWLVHLLSSIRNGNRLEVIELEVYIPHKEDLADVISWADIDSILAGPGFPHLREVAVDLNYRGGGGGPDLDEECADVVRSLPLLRGRGVSVNLH
jgi:hypothetical protein